MSVETLPSFAMMMTGGWGRRSTSAKAALPLTTAEGTGDWSTTRDRITFAGKKRESRCQW